MRNTFSRQRLRVESQLFLKLAAGKPNKNKPREIATDFLKEVRKLLGPELLVLFALVTHRVLDFANVSKDPQSLTTLKKWKQKNAEYPQSLVELTQKYDSSLAEQGTLGNDVGSEDGETEDGDQVPVFPRMKFLDFAAFLQMEIHNERGDNAFDIVWPRGESARFLVGDLTMARMFDFMRRYNQVRTPLAM